MHSIYWRYSDCPKQAAKLGPQPARACKSAICLAIANLRHSEAPIIVEMLDRRRDYGVELFDSNRENNGLRLVRDLLYWVTGGNIADTYAQNNFIHYCIVFHCSSWRLRVADASRFW